MSSENEICLLCEISSASNSGDLDRVKELISLGADPSIDSGCNTALPEAIGSNHFCVAEALIDAGADPNRSDPHIGALPIALALQNQNENLLKLLRKKEAILENELVLSFLPQGDNPKLLLLAAKHGFDINFKEKERGKTALHICSSYGYLATVKVLISMGAKTNVLDSSGLSPENLAERNGHTTVALHIRSQKSA